VLRKEGSEKEGGWRQSSTLLERKKGPEGKERWKERKMNI